MNSMPENCNTAQKENTVKHAEPVSTRRVGTVTMAVSLIVVGVLIIINSFNESLSMMMIARLAPSILIVLGIEILIRYSFSKGERLKYDFLSGFVCFCLIVGSFILAIVPELIDNFGPRRDWLEQSLQKQATQKVVVALEEEKLTHVSCYVDLYREVLSDDMTLDDLKPIDEVQLNIQLVNDFENKDAFAQKSGELLKKALSTEIPFSMIHIDVPSENGLYGYSLYLDSALGYDIKSEQIGQYIETYYSAGEDMDYSAAANFAESYFDEFARFVAARKEAMPEDYIARCRAFAKHHEEAYHMFQNGEDVKELLLADPLTDSYIGEIEAPDASDETVSAEEKESK